MVREGGGSVGLKGRTFELNDHDSILGRLGYDVLAELAARYMIRLRLRQTCATLSCGFVYAAT